MTLRLVIDGTHVTSLDDVYDLIGGLPAMPDWFGRNLNAVDELAYFVKEPLEITVLNPGALERNLGGRDYKQLMSVLEGLHDFTDEEEPVQAITLTIQRQ